MSSKVQTEASNTNIGNQEPMTNLGISCINENQNLHLTHKKDRKDGKEKKKTKGRETTHMHGSIERTRRAKKRKEKERARLDMLEQERK